MTDLVWYAAYGSNLHLARFTCYLAGGRPAGSRRTYAGCRDSTPPRAVVPLRLPGRLHFGGESSVWGGGVAVLEAGGRGEVAAAAYLMSREQVCDVVAQETRQECGAVSDLDAPPGGAGWYDVVLRVEHDEVPVHALAASRPPPPNQPSKAYLATMVEGLRSTLGWSHEECVAYLARVTGSVSGAARAGTSRRSAASQ